MYMSENAFIGKTVKPGADELSATLGRSLTLWDQLIKKLEKKGVIDNYDWHSYSPKAGWSLRVKLAKRTILYMTPQHGGFMVSFAFGDSAVQAIRAGTFSRSLIAIVESSRKYAEGTGVRLDVKNASDVASVVKLAAIKASN